MKRVGITETPTLAPEGQEENDELTVLNRVRVWNGSLAKLRAVKPVPGTVDASGYTVIKSSLKSKAAGQGVLTVTISKQIDRLTVGLSAGPVKDTFNIAWARAQRPLKQHPRWETIDTTTWAAADAWEREEDYSLRSDYKYRVPSRDENGKWLHDEDGLPVYDVLEVSASIHDYCDKRMKGVESWDDFNPVVTRTRVYRYEPETGDCGKISTCPKPIGGYVFLKVSDNLSNQGNRGMWSRTESWEGYEAIDEDLYSAAAAAARRKVKGKTRE
jgi:hypothetical protein